MFVIVNLAHPGGPHVLLENDSGVYEHVTDAKQDALAAALRYNNENISVYAVSQAFKVSTLISGGGWLCRKCLGGNLNAERFDCVHCGEDRETR